MSFALQMVDFLASKYLSYRGALHLRTGYPQVAIFAFDYIGHEINLSGRYEKGELDTTLQFLREEGRVAGIAVDVGANIGNHSLFFADHYERVVALEPNPRVFELLSINAKLKHNIEPLGIAASDTGGPATLRFEPGNWGAGQLVEGGEGPAESFSIVTKRLDDLEQITSRKVGLLKIDVEGHELRALKGGTGILARSRPVVLFEQHASDISRGSSEVIDWLRRNGYERFFEVRSFPGLPKAWLFPGRKAVNGLLRLVFGERKKVVPVTRFEKAFYPMIIALPSG
jgi:FkbM family methyltransferase